MSGKLTAACVDPFYEDSDVKCEIELPSKNMFNVGDIIKCINVDDKWAINSGLSIGEEYTVSDKNDYRVTVKANYHAKGNFWIDSSCFELVAAVEYYSKRIRYK